MTRYWALASALFLSVAPAFTGEAAKVEERVWYDGSLKLPPGWKAEGWREMETAMDDSVALPGRAASLRLSPRNEEILAWAGARLGLKTPDLASDRFYVAPGDWKDGALNLQIRADGASNATGGLPLQVALVFQEADGTERPSGYIRARLSENPDQVGAAAGWKQVSIPLRAFLENPPKKETLEIVQIKIQTASATPVLDRFFVGQIGIGALHPFAGKKSSVARDAKDPQQSPAHFDELGQLSPPFLVPRDEAFPVDTEGNFTFEGKPRFLIGAELAEWLQSTYAPTSGYPAELKWLYEQPLNYETAQRIGIDTIGLFMPPRWVASVDKDRARVVEPGGVDYVQRVIREARLPLYVDMTCANWLHGALERSKVISPAALNSGGGNGQGNHWVPYSVTTPEGRALYLKMFTDTAEQIVSAGGKALYYELFNEPAYDDPSPYNRDLFAKRLEREYGGIARLNKLWHSSYPNFAEAAHFRSPTDCPPLTVEWSKFMEDAFVELCREGVAAIHAVDPGKPAITVQPSGGDYYRVLPKDHVNLYKLGKLFPLISLNTGGGIPARGSGGLTAAPLHTIDTPYVSQRFEGLVSSRFFLSIARGKPLVNGEFYFNSHTASDGFWLGVARGANAAFIFHWTKRAWDRHWGPEKDAEGGRKMAELFPYNILNPYAAPPSKLADIAGAKREILSLSDLFVPRQNFSKPPTGLLLSFPTERYSQGSGSRAHNFVRNYGVALDFAHLDYGVVLEEQLEEGKLDDFKVLVAAGVENVASGTSPRIQKWVEKGGTLVLALEALQKDEIGNPQKESDFLDLKLGGELAAGDVILQGAAPRLASLPGPIKARPYREILASPGWETVASLGRTPAILRRSLGKGEVYFINAKMLDYAVSSVLGGILRERNVFPLAELNRTDNQEQEVNLELRKFSHESLTGYFLFNWDAYPKMFTFRCPELAVGTSLVDPLRKESFEIRDGSATLWIPANTKRVLVAGPSKTLGKRFGDLPRRDPAAVAKEFNAARAVTKVEAKDDQKDFAIDGAKTLTLDLRPVANRGFQDGVAGDGKGGWTDQGENSLHGEEWGRQVYRGVPFEIIRPDMNGGNGVIVLSSSKIANAPTRVSDIPLGESGSANVRKLFFLHATGWSDKGVEAMRYVLHHPDGTATEIPIRCGKEVGDWWIPGKNPDLSDTTRVGWKSMDGRGFWINQWVNPNPQKAISSIELRSSGHAPIPIVIAITAELE